jgi:hypothetical protein
MARAITIPAAPAKPWIRRRTSSTAMDGANAHPLDAAMNNRSPPSSGARRPATSLFRWPAPEVDPDLGC